MSGSNEFRKRHRHLLFSHRFQDMQGHIFPKGKLWKRKCDQLPPFDDKIGEAGVKLGEQNQRSEISHALQPS